LSSLAPEAPSKTPCIHEIDNIEIKNEVGSLELTEKPTTGYNNTIPNQFDPKIHSNTVAIAVSQILKEKKEKDQTTATKNHSSEKEKPTEKGSNFVQITEQTKNLQHTSRIPDQHTQSDPESLKSDDQNAGTDKILKPQEKRQKKSLTARIVSALKSIFHLT
jgi:hypothetical protein